MAKYLDMSGVAYLLVRVRQIVEDVTSGALDLTDYVTRTELQNELKALNINIDLSNYVTNEALATALSSYVKPSTLSAYVKTSALASYVKTEDLEDYLQSSDLEGFATESFVTNAINNAQLGGEDGTSIDLSIYATTDAMNTALANKAEKIHTHDYATKDYVDGAMENVSVDLTNYYTKTETDNAINAAQPDLSDFATEAYVNEKIEDIEFTAVGTTVSYGTEEPTDGSIVWINPDGKVDEYATKEYVDEAVSKIDINGVEIDLTDYAKTIEVNIALAGKANLNHTHDEYLTEHQDLSSYAKKTDIPTVPTKVSELENDKGYLTEHQDISGKADTGHKHVLADITNYSAPNLTNYATKTYVQEQIDAIEVTGGGGVGSSDSTTKGEIFNDYTNNVASGDYAHAEGKNTTASGHYSHAEGNDTIASGDWSHAEGHNSKAEGDRSHAEGHNAVASGEFSHAEGNGTKAIGKYSHAEGIYTTASGEAQHVQGKYNIEDTENRYAHIVGNGKFDSYSFVNKYSNCHTLDWNGNAWFKGNVYIGGTSMDDATLLGSGGENVDLSNYYNKEEVDALIPDIPTILTETEINTLIDNKLGVIENGTY